MSESEILDRLGERLLDEFDTVARAGFIAYRKTPIDLLVEHGPRSAASCTYDHMVAEADRHFKGRDDVRDLEIRGLKIWVFGNHTVIRWKKMDEDGKSRNYPTKQAKAYDLGDELPGLPPPPVRLTVGYVLDPTNTSVLRVQIAKPSGEKNVEWCAAIVPVAERILGQRIWVDVTKQRGFGEAA